MNPDTQRVCFPKTPSDYRQPTRQECRHSTQQKNRFRTHSHPPVSPFLHGPFPSLKSTRAFPVPNRPHLLCPDKVLAVHLARRLASPYLASQQSHLNAGFRNTQVVNDSLPATIQSSRAEINALLSRLKKHKYF
ncbi:hypothetical protein LX32DRAFT_131658 [Colletotrichum zoysiae]|uniref:Uncharacterized protein n=1 Tax=Colletotrichum zoysiae TaxID=1216348 RepID=A0AAD9H974_9PEZI|nr:hypothetical protein LX32DRAFT_131658 [Colletotrichum zoysiae]